MATLGGGILLIDIYECLGDWLVKGFSRRCQEFEEQKQDVREQIQELRRDFEESGHISEEVGTLPQITRKLH